MVVKPLRNSETLSTSHNVVSYLLKFVMFYDCSLNKLCFYTPFSYRLLTTVLQGSGSVIWGEALVPEHILCRIIWIAENTLNTQLLIKVWHWIFLKPLYMAHQLAVFEMFQYQTISVCL